MSLDLASIVVPKASDVLASKLRDLILSKGLAEGDSLPSERALVTQTGLSRTSVREALRILATEGLVITKAGRSGGSQVRLPGRQSVARSIELFVQSQAVRFEALLEAREAIESAAARLAAIHRTKDDLAKMKSIHALFEKRSDNVVEFVRLNLEWHRAVMNASRNELLIAFFEAIAQSVHAATEVRNLNSSKIRREVVRVHERILSAIEEKDFDAAFRRMQGHLRSYALRVRQVSARNEARAGTRRM